MDWVKLLLSPQGRITRAPFWFGIMVIIIASLALRLIPVPIVRLLSLALLWPQICVNAKRLHDMGRTGWLMLVPYVVSVACVVVGFVMNAGGGFPPRPAVAPLALAGLVSLGFLFWLGLTPSQAGANRFGEAP